jgi:hypothetical protein
MRDLEYVEILIREGGVGQTTTIGEAWVDTYTGQIVDVKVFEENWKEIFR